MGKIRGNAIVWTMSTKYFGFGVPGDKAHTRFEEYYDSESPPLLLKIENTLQNWTKLGLSLLGRINVLIMMIIPQINLSITYKPSSLST